MSNKEIKMQIIDIKQHYVPQFYLKNFGEQLHAFDKKTGRKFSTISKNIAMGKNFYGGEISGAPSIEQALSKIESGFSGAIHELIQKENYQLLSDESKIKIHNFLALQYIRTPAHRKEIVEMYNYVLNEIAKSKGIKDHSIKLSEQGEIGTHLKSIVDYPLFGMLIGHMKFVTMINKTPIPFWISDNPVCFDNFVPSAGGNRGIISTGIQIHLPVTPKIMLVALDPEFFEHLESVNEVYNKNAIMFENFLQVENSSRWIFSHTRKFHELKNMLEQHPELKNPERDRANIHGGTMGNSDVIGFMRQNSRSGVLREGGIDTWMPIEQYEEIKEFYDKISKSRVQSVSQDNTLPDSES